MHLALATVIEIVRNISRKLSKILTVVCVPLGLRIGVSACVISSVFIWLYNCLSLCIRAFVYGCVFIRLYVYMYLSRDLCLKS